MAKLTQAEAEKFLGKSVADWTDHDQERLRQYEETGVDGAAQISETHTPTAEELHNRVQALEAVFERVEYAEALLDYLFSNYFRNTDRAAIVAEHAERQKGSPQLAPPV